MPHHPAAAAHVGGDTCLYTVNVAMLPVTLYLWLRLSARADGLFLVHRGSLADMCCVGIGGQ